MPILGIDGSRAVQKEKTGVEWYSHFLLAAMKRCVPKGWRVRCYVPRWEMNYEFDTNIRITNENWKWRKLGWPFARGWVQGRLSLEMLAHPVEALFVPSRILPLVHPPKTVTTVHDAVFLNHPELYEPQDLWLQKRGLEFAIRFARRIIVPSQTVREDVIRAGAGREQVVVVRHGVEGTTNYEFDTNIRITNPPIRIFGADSYFAFQNYILFIGRLERKKNVLGLVQAFRRLIDYPSPQSPPTRGEEADRVSSPLMGEDKGGGETKLVLAGHLGYGGEDVLQAIKTFKLQERVVHLGWVSRPAMAGLLQNAALLVLPSIGEGFGLPVLEAMAQGTPVVCSDIPVLHELGGKAVQYINPRDPEDIARGLQTVLDSPMLQSEMIKRGKERAEQYSWEKSAQCTWDVITSL